MSRLRRFAHSLASGYVVMAANVIFTLGSVPLAWKYLSREEFGLWALVAQIAGYLSLVDLGMAAAASRILVEYKDHRHDNAYGSAIKTLTLVNFAQGLGVMLISFGLIWFLGPLLNVPSPMEGLFQRLLLWQAFVVAVTFFTRTAVFLLAAHQRYDLANYGHSLSFIFNLGALALLLQQGWGVFAMIWAQLLAGIVTAVISGMAVLKLRLLPKRGHWGRANWSSFRVFFAYGGDMFLYAIGGQLVQASQTILITRTLGLDAAAVWAVCTRTFNLVSQLVFRVFDYACAGLAEIIVREETSRLLRSFRLLVSVSASLTIWAATLFVFANQPFIDWWTDGKVGWSWSNDLLLGVWLFFTVLTRLHTGLVGLRKDFRFMRYIYFLEGLFFVVAGTVALHLGGIPALLLTSIAATLGFSFTYGLRRSKQSFGLTWRSVTLGWLKPAGRLALLLFPLTLICAWLTHSLSNTGRLVVAALLPGFFGAILLVRFGLDPELKAQVRDLVPNRFSGLRRFL